MTDTLDRKHSVTKADYLATAEPGGVWYWMVSDPGSMQSPVVTLPRHGLRSRDEMLTATLDLEDMWSSAVTIACTKIAVRGYEIKDSDDSTRRTEKGQSLVMNFDGAAQYRSGMVKVAQDFLLTDNGWFVEVEREGISASSRPKALWHLDSLRCWRTGNMKYPVIYLDYEGNFHKIPAHNIIYGADMSSPRARLYNIGRCAASRAFQTIVKLSAVETYFREKITGSRALALYFVSGISSKQLVDAIDTSEAEKTRKGHVVYKGAVMVPIQGDQPINVATIDLAGVPDGFNVDSERDDGYLRYTKALGLSAQGIKPLSGQGLGTGKQTETLDDVVDEEGCIAYFTKYFEDQINFLIMPKPTTFTITVNDLRNRIRNAELDKMKADTLVALMGSGQAPGVITQEMALQIAVDEGLVPREYLPKDVTSEGVLTDSGEQSKPAGAIQFALPAPAPVQTPQLPVVKEYPMEQLTIEEIARQYYRLKEMMAALGIEPVAYRIGDIEVPATKAADVTDDLIDHEYDAALALLRKIANEPA